MSCQSSGRADGGSVIPPDRTPVRFAPDRSTAERSSPDRSAPGPKRYPAKSCQPDGNLDGVPVIPPDRTPVKSAGSKSNFVLVRFAPVKFTLDMSTDEL